MRCQNPHQHCLNKTKTLKTEVWERLGETFREVWERLGSFWVRGGVLRETGVVYECLWEDWGRFGVTRESLVGKGKLMERLAKVKGVTRGGLEHT